MTLMHFLYQKKGERPRYLCNQAVVCKSEYMTIFKDKVTCKNCLQRSEKNGNN